eukprot:8835251-Alexandrium_andersonii.AAC.1
MGPVGLLLGSICGLGLELRDGDCIIGQAGEQVRMLSSPHQQLKARCQSIATQAKVACFEAARPSLAGNGNIDHHATTKLCCTLDSTDACLLRRILIGGVWVGSDFDKMKCKAEDRPSSACAWCGEASETLEHLWWHCP